MSEEERFFVTRNGIISPLRGVKAESRVSLAHERDAYTKDGRMCLVPQVAEPTVWFVVGLALIH